MKERSKMKKQLVIIGITLVLLVISLSGCTESKDKFVGTWTDRQDMEWTFSDDGKLLWFGYMDAYYKEENNCLYISTDSGFPTDNTLVWDYEFYDADTLIIKCISVENGSSYTLHRD